MSLSGCFCCCFSLFFLFAFLKLERVDRKLDDEDVMRIWASLERENVIRIYCMKLKTSRTNKHNTICRALVLEFPPPIRSDIYILTTIQE